MHIAEGVLSPSVIIAGYAAAGLGTAWGLRKIESQDIPGTAALSAAFFTASLIHVNIGPASTHLLLNGLAGIILGPRVFPAILTALLMQVLFFSYGGLSTLGINTADMAFPALLVYCLSSKFIRKTEAGFSLWLAGFVAGASATVLSCIMTAGMLFLSDSKYGASAFMLFASHIPVMAIEGIVTGFALNFLKKVKPEIFGKDC